MTPSSRHLWQRVYINGIERFTDAGSAIVINESLSSLTRVAEFDLARQPGAEPDVGDDVRIDWIDFENGIYWTIFGGTINSLEVESQPWRFTVRATGQLALLRKVRTGDDKDFSGMTEGTAWKYVMDACGINYDDADVADTGYELGERVAVKWLLDTPASSVIQSLDEVFGMATIEIGDDRVIRFPYDPVPDDGTGSVATYERGASIDFQGHRRSYGDRDRIQNIWIVRGANVQIDENCSGQVWARSVATNPQLGRRVRVQTQEFQSDLIQDEAVAEALVRRFMSISNRSPDEATATAENNPNVHPGSKITITDTTYGIDADPRYFTVTSVDRTGFDMSLTLVAGPGGGEGTVTHGVDRVCNDTHTDTDWPGSFDFPPFDTPPVIPGTDIDFDFPTFTWEYYGGFPEPPGGGGGETPTSDETADGFDYCITPTADDWEVTTGSASFSDGGITLPNVSTPAEVSLISAHLPLNPPNRIRVRGSFESSSNGTTGAPIMSVNLQDGTDYAGLQAEWFPVSGDGFFYTFGFDGGFHQTDYSDLFVSGGFDFEFTNVIATGEIVSRLNNAALANVSNGPFSDAVLLIGGAAAESLEFRFTSLRICFADDGSSDSLAIVEFWVPDSETANHAFTAGGDVITDFGAAHYIGDSRTLGDSWALSGTITPTVTNSAQVGMGADGLSFEYYFTIYSTSDGGGVELGSLVGSDFNASDYSAGSHTFVLAYDGVDTLTLNLDSGALIMSHTTDDTGNPPAVPLYVSVRGYSNPSGGNTHFSGLGLA